MSNCLNCNKEVPQVEGKRARKYCDNKGKCKYDYFYKQKNKNKVVLIKDEDGQWATADGTRVRLEIEKVVEENNKPDNKKKIEEERNGVDKAEQDKREYPLTENEATNPDRETLIAEIQKIKEEKIPSWRNTPLGTRSFRLEQQQRISAIQQKINELNKQSQEEI